MRDVNGGPDVEVVSTADRLTIATATLRAIAAMPCIAALLGEYDYECGCAACQANVTLREIA